MSILDALLYGVGVVGNTLDTPGALVRNTLSGRDPFAGLNPFDAEGRASGRDMLESWGVLGANQEGLDWGDAAGFGAELLTDPLNFIGGLGTASKFAKSRAAFREGNAAADAAVAAAKASNLGMDQLASRAADVAQHADDARIFSQTGMVAGKPDTVVDLLRVDPRVSESLDRPVVWPGQQLTDAEKLTLLHGTQEDAAAVASKLTGYPLTEPHPAVSAMYARSGTRPFGIDTAHRTALVRELDPQGVMPFSQTGLGGFVMSDRPDMAFVTNEGTLPRQLGVGSHEAVHAMAHSYPSARRNMEAFLTDGDLMANPFRKSEDEVFLDNLSMLSRDKTRSGILEEDFATKVGNEAIRGTAKQRFPTVDNAFMSTNPHYPPDAGLVDELAAMIGRNADVVDKEAAAEELLAFLSGHTRQQHSIIPTGRGSRFTPYRSFAGVQPPVDTSGLKYLDITRPDVGPDSTMRNIAPLLAALLGHNALARGGLQ